MHIRLSEACALRARNKPQFLTADDADGRSFFRGWQDKYGASKVENVSLGALMMMSAIGEHEKNLGVKE
jgi:hypothetical protein